MAPSRSSESGSVVFYILIACALFAALSLAVANMMRGGGNGNVSELPRLSATQVIQYADTVRNAVRTMGIDGVPENSLCFNTPSWGNNNYNFGACGDTANDVFDPAGGAVVWERPSSDMNDGSPWLFTGTNGVKDVGTTCLSASCSDLQMILPNVRKAVCLAINDSLGVANPGGEPPVDTGYDIAPFVGVYDTSGTGDLGNEAGSADLAGHQAGCFQSTTLPAGSGYHFYRVLLSR